MTTPNMLEKAYNQIQTATPPQPLDQKRLTAQMEEWQINGSPAEKKAVEWILNALTVKNLGKYSADKPEFKLTSPAEIQALTECEIQRVNPALSQEQVTQKAAEKLNMIYSYCENFILNMFGEAVISSLNNAMGKPEPVTEKAAPLSYFDKKCIELGLSVNPKKAEPYVKATKTAVNLSDKELLEQIKKEFR